jgi:hypothetical protein
VSKDKLHYIISNQTENTLVVLKYNEKAEIKLSEFMTTLIDYYKQNKNIKNVFDKMIVEGNEHFSIIKNIPKVKLGNKELINVLNENIIKLLK